MSKRINKIICVIASAVAALCIASAAGCTDYFKSDRLTGDGIFTDTPAVSNGGFAVSKGDYIYFINGVESNTANNEYGKPVKGAIYRISKDNLEKRNYSSAEAVVPLVTYSGNTNGGIFIYGDYIYYGTPSTAKNSDAVVQNTYLDMKSTKLDGTETMKDYYVQFPSLSYEYRFVEENGTVYLLYVATEEKLFDESTGVTNLHSYNTKTGKDTLLAYNTSSVLFDKQDKTNSRVYYTMNVRDYVGGSDFDYNQVYTVTASAEEDRFAGKLSSETVTGWDDETDRYINCGALVLDGIGGVVAEKTPINYLPEEPSVKNTLSYNYTLSAYVNGNLFYTRKTVDVDGDTHGSDYLFSLKDTAALEPIDGNPDAAKRILTDGSSAANYEYLFDASDELEAVIIAESNGGITINKVSDNGKLQTEINNTAADSDYFNILKEGTATLLSLDTENRYLYYSVTGGNGYTINRVLYDGNAEDYIPLASKDNDYQPVKILDLDASSTWYKPEFIDEYLLFASETTHMTGYNYVMVFDMRGENGIMTNSEIKALNEKYNGIEDIIKDTYGDTDKYPTDIYANVQNALRYAFYTGDADYIKELAKAVNAEVEEDADPVYSEQTLREYEQFLSASGVWAEYAEDTRVVNGKTVTSNMREYYYSVLGKMTDSDKKAYGDGLKTSYLVSYPEPEKTGWDAMSTAARVWVILGPCLGAALIAGGTVTAVILVRKKKKKLPAMRKKRVKVDTTDDKNIDVYSDDTQE